MRIARAVCVGLLGGGLAWGGPGPNADLSPQQVVRIVAESLQHNDSPIPNAGIFTAYQYASPANHAVTGPYGHFLRLVRHPDFAPMFRPYAQEFEEMRMDGDRAEQVLKLRMENGRSVSYRFILSRQKDGRCGRCWMMDGVVRVR